MFLMKNERFLMKNKNVCEKESVCVCMYEMSILKQNKNTEY
jgi:hypothetical protein